MKSKQISMATFRRQSLLLLLALGCIILPGPCVAHTAAQLTSATIFEDESEFKLACATHGLHTHTYSVTPESLAAAIGNDGGHIGGPPVSDAQIKSHDGAPRHVLEDRAFLGTSLSLEPHITGVCVSVLLRQLAGVEAAGGFVYRRLDEATSSSLQRRGGFRLGGDLSGQTSGDALQLNSRPGNDDIEMVFSTHKHTQAQEHSSTKEFVQLYAIALRLMESPNTAGERIIVKDFYGEEIATIDRIPRTTQNHPETFVGMISPTPIGSLVFDENSRDTDPVLLTHIVVATGPAHLLDGVPRQYRTIFWLAFNLFVGIMLAIDMVVGSRRTVALSDAIFWSIFWICLAMGFALLLYLRRGSGPAVVWVTSYLLEKFLSVDNLFVFLTLFATFHTPARFQHKVLMWGIIGAIGLRAIFIFMGVVLIQAFEWLLAGFGAFLVYTGVRAFYEYFTEDPDEAVFSFDSSPSRTPFASGTSSPTGVPNKAREMALRQNLLIRIMGSFIPLSLSYDPKGRFFVPPEDVEDVLGHTGSEGERPSLIERVVRPIGKLVFVPVSLVLQLVGAKGYHATPLFAVLLIVETTDMVFAADSIPAVLSITQDPFIAYTSNIFAVLGLRALYFALAAAMTKFVYLAPALGIILSFIGVKMLLAMAGIHFAIELTLAVVLGVLFLAVLLSLWRPKETPHSMEQMPRYHPIGTL